MMGYASYTDLRTREVSDKLWILFSAIGVAIGVYEYLYGSLTQELLMILLSFGITTAISVALYRFGFFGGADAKALIVISILLPLTTASSTIHPFTGIIILTNAALITAFLAISYAIRNLVMISRGEKIFIGFESEPLWKKVAAVFLGFRVRDASKHKFLLSLEENAEGVRRFRFSLLREEDEFVKEGDVWVTPGIPFIVFLTAGLFVTILAGDLLMTMTRNIVSYF